MRVQSHKVAPASVPPSAVPPYQGGIEGGRSSSGAALSHSKNLPRPLLSKERRKVGDHKGLVPIGVKPSLGAEERSAQRTLREVGRPRALTMVELLVVITIIVVLFSSIFVASHRLLDSARGTNTRALLQVVSDAVEQFAREQKSNPTIAKAVQPSGTPPKPYAYTERYGEYPPDDLEVFTPVGVPGWTASTAVGGWSLAPNKASIFPALTATAKWPHMHFDTHGDTTKDPLEHRDLAALIVAIETLGNESKVLLDRVPDRNRTSGPVDMNGAALIFLDRSPQGDPNVGKWDVNDLQIRYIVDDWGVPLSYFATRDWVKPAAVGADLKASSNHPKWREASTQFVRMNKGLPVIMSYGPNGKEQQSEEWMHRKGDGSGGEGLAEASLVGDYIDNTEDHKINHPLNEDNVYLDPDLKERLAKGPVVAKP